jgi:hypothetical protein
VKCELIAAADKDAQRHGSPGAGFKKKGDGSIFHFGSLFGLPIGFIISSIFYVFLSFPENTSLP